MCENTSPTPASCSLPKPIQVGSLVRGDLVVGLLASDPEAFVIVHASRHTGFFHGAKRLVEYVKGGVMQQGLFEAARTVNVNGNLRFWYVKDADGHLVRVDREET